MLAVKYLGANYAEGNSIKWYFITLKKDSFAWQRDLCHGSKEIKVFVMFVMISTVIWSETCALGNPMYYIQPLQISLPFSSVLHIHL